MTIRAALLSLHGDPLARLGGTHHGGQNVYVKELSRYLTELDVEVDVFSRWESDQQPARETITEGARVIRINVGPGRSIPKEQTLSLLPDISRWMVDYCREHELTYDLIHSHYYFSGAVGVYLSNLWGIPLLHTYHSLGAVKEKALGQDDPSPEQRIAVEKKISQTADRIIATAPQEKSDLTKYYGADSSKVAVVPCGVNLELFQPVPRKEARREIGFSPRDFLVTYVGRLEKRKGIDTLLQALHILEDDEVQAVIVGGPQTRKDFLSWTELGEEPFQVYRALMEEYDLAGQVTFTGGKDQSELSKYYSAADVTVIPSYYEPFGLTAIEAMACGSSVIASRVGGLKTSVEEDHVGLLFDPRNPRNLADKIERLKSFPPTNQKYQENARPYVIEKFSWSQVTRQIVEIYHRVLRE